METNNGTHRTSVSLLPQISSPLPLHPPDHRSRHVFCRLKTECCAYDGLAGAFELKTVLLEAGDRYEGGRVAGRPAYDLVKEVRKTVSTDNQ